MRVEEDERRTRAGIIWDILIAHCGASALVEDRRSFLVNRSLEYRFGGNLGLGGKVYLDHPPYVACYAEDLTRSRSQIIKAANRMLATVGREYRCWEGI